MTSATIFGSEADGLVQICATLTFGTLEGNVTLSFGAVNTCCDESGESCPHNYTCWATPTLDSLGL